MFTKNKKGIIGILTLLIIFGVFIVWGINSLDLSSPDFKVSSFGISDEAELFINCYVDEQEKVCSQFDGRIIGFDMPTCEFPPEKESIGKKALAESFNYCNDLYIEALNEND